MLTYLLFLLGFVALIKGADFLVAGAAALARQFKISDLVIGLTVVAFGTSAPELAVSLLASLQGSTQLAIGNILGSNIANILLILGVAAIIHPLVVHRNTVWKEIPFSLLAVLVLAFVANDALIDDAPRSAITRIDGLILISFLLIFLYYVFGIARSTPPSSPAKPETTKSDSIAPVPKSEPDTWKSIFLVVVGLAGLVAGGNWIVDGAIEIAGLFGVSQSLIGLTVVAIGTSLPELATSALAAYRKNADIAVGNAVGSNILNIFWILGTSALIQPLPFQSQNNLDVVVAILASVLLFSAVFVNKHRVITRPTGILFVTIYVSYIIFLVIQG
jgi:cation:H+ antiporter